MSVTDIAIDVDGAHRVSGLLQMPQSARSCLVLGHGAGAGMRHPSMVSLAAGLFERGIATLRFQFPYMEQGGRRTDPPPLCHATVRAAAETARQHAPGLVLFAGGRSFGGRMTSQAQASRPLEGVRGLVFFAFPLHPAGKPGIERAAHLARIAVPMLFLQGTRDALAELSLLQPMIDGLGEPARLHLIEDADHSFHVPAKSGRNDADALSEMLDDAARWMSAIR